MTVISLLTQISANRCLTDNTLVNLIFARKTQKVNTVPLISVIIMPIIM